jgi:hypothetical protein
MTNELRRALARCELARARYRLAVVASYTTPGRGYLMWAAIRNCQAARAALRQLTSRMR